MIKPLLSSVSKNIKTMESDGHFWQIETRKNFENLLDGFFKIFLVIKDL